MNAAFLTWSVLSALLRLGTASRAPPPERAPGPTVVVLDPGHGGSSKGACASGMAVCEKTFALRLAAHVQAALETLPGVRVVLTRSSDVHLSLYMRARIAQAAGAHVFISLHANASPGRDQQGFEAFVYPPPGDFRLLSGNASTVAPPDLSPEAWQISTILQDLRRQALRRCSVVLGDMLLSHMAASLPARNNRGLKQQNLAVLAGLTIPGVLLEVGFVDHPIEGRLLVTTDSQRRIAAALRNAILQWTNGPGRKDCSPSALNQMPGSSGRLAVPADPKPPATRKWKPRRWKSGHLPNAVPDLTGPPKTRGLLVWST